MNEYLKQNNITFLSALFGLFFGVMTFLSLLMAGATFKTAVLSGILAFAVAMLVAHIFMNIQDLLEIRRYRQFEKTLGDGVAARFMGNIFTDDDTMCGMIYLLRTRLVLAYIGHRQSWDLTLMADEMAYAEQIDSMTVQIGCSDGGSFRLMVSPAEKLIEGLRAMGVTIIETPAE